MRYLAWSSFLCFIAAVSAAPTSKPLGNIKMLPNVNDALALVKADLLTLATIHRPFMWYIWIDSGGIDQAKVAAWGVNVPSRTSDIERPVPLGKGSLIVLRLDLRLYAPTDTDIQEWLQIREEFQFEPKLSLLITKDTIKQLRFEEGDEIPTIRQTVTRTIKKKIAATGKKKTKTIEEEVTEELDVPITEAKDIDVVKLLPDHIDKTLFAEIVAMTGTKAPMVSWNYFRWRALNTIQDKGPFKAIYGGLYYELAGIKENKTGKGTDEDLWFQDHVGIGNIEAGVTAEKFYNKLRSDRRSAIWKSKFTGRVRRIDWGHGPSDGDGFGPWSITHDPLDADIDISQHALFNLLKLKDSAREAIWARPNGMHGYALFNGQGKLQREVPPELVVNTEIPVGHGPRRLQAGIGCISCHEAKADGWQPFGNDAKELLGDILGDTSNAKAGVFDTQDRIRRLYGSDPLVSGKWLTRGRDDYAAKTLAATGPWVGQGAQVNIVRFAAEKLWTGYVDHLYKPVDAKQMLWEIGLDVPEGEVKDLFNRLVPPVQDLGLGPPEDVRTLALRRGQSINRIDANFVHSFIAQRAAKTLNGLKGKP